MGVWEGKKRFMLLLTRCRAGCIVIQAPFTKAQRNAKHLFGDLKTGTYQFINTSLCSCLLDCSLENCFVMLELISGITVKRICKKT